MRKIFQKLLPFTFVVKRADRRADEFVLMLHDVLLALSDRGTDIKYSIPRELFSSLKAKLFLAKNFKGLREANLLLLAVAGYSIRIGGVHATL